jgi:hypothetical protein
MPKKSMKGRNVYILLLLLSMVVPAVEAQIKGAGSGVFYFLSLPSSSRLAALGGENVSLSDGDVSMSFVNPALLNSETHMVLQLNYAYHMAGTMFGSAMYGHNWGDNYFAANVHYLDYGRMYYADEYGEMNGSTFGAQDICVDVVYARQLGPMFRIGTALKPVFSSYERYTSLALGADIGGHFQTEDSLFQMGLALRNVGWQLKSFYEEDMGHHTEMLPLNLELGMSLRLAHAPLRFSFTYHDLQSWDLSYSGEAEVKWHDMLLRHTIWAIEIVPKSDKFYLAVSYNHRRQKEMSMLNIRSMAGFAFGGGLNLKKFRLGFAMSQYTKSNFTYQASLSLDMGELVK